MELSPANQQPEKKQPIIVRALRGVGDLFAIKLRRSGTVLLLLISLLAGFAGGYLGRNEVDLEPTASTASQRQVINNENDLISQIAKDASPSVVSIDITSESTRRSFFGDQPATRQSAGTGFILSANGIIATNRHVIPEGASSVSVTLQDGTKFTDVEVVGKTNASDPLDIAFLRIKDRKGKELNSIKLADSSQVQVGDRVVAIGNALGQFQNTITTGIISGYGRSLEAGDGDGAESLQNMFQTDAAINQGNSGGPLVNIQGEVIGINTAVAGGDAQNIGFAIPINDVKGLVKGVLQTGKLERPYLGIRYVTLTDDYAYEYNLPAKRGAYIAPMPDGESILPGSPASKSGLKEKDIITKVNKDLINEKNSLSSLLSRYSVGDKVTLTVLRDGKERRIDIKLEAMPAS